MDKDLEKLYKYCKSPREFKKELENLALDQLDSEELSDVSGGKKITTALAASLVSVLSIAAPYVSANILPVQKPATTRSTDKKPTAPEFAIPTRQGSLNAVRAKNLRNQQKNNDYLDNKACRLITQLLTRSFDVCARYYWETSPENQREINTRINENGYQKIGNGIERLETLSKICRAIIGVAPGNIYQPFYHRIKDLIIENEKVTKDGNGNVIIDDNVIMLVGSTVVDPYETLINDPLKIYEWCLMTEDSLAEKVITDRALQASMSKLEDVVNTLQTRLQTQLPPNPSTQSTQQLVPEQQSDSATTIKTMFVDCEKYLFNASKKFMDAADKLSNLRLQDFWLPYEELYKAVEDQVSEINSLIKKVSSGPLCKSLCYQQTKKRLISLRENLAARIEDYQFHLRKKGYCAIMQDDLWEFVETLYKCRVDMAAEECAIKLINIPNYNDYYCALRDIIDSEKNFIKDYVKDYNPQRALSYFHQRYDLFRLFCANLRIDIPTPMELPWSGDSFNSNLLKARNSIPKLRELQKQQEKDQLKILQPSAMPSRHQACYLLYSVEKSHKT